LKFACQFYDLRLRLSFRPGQKIMVEIYRDKAWAWTGSDLLILVGENLWSSSNTDIQCRSNQNVYTGQDLKKNEICNVFTTCHLILWFEPHSQSIWSCFYQNTTQIELHRRVLSRAMRKDFISAFSCFASFVLRFIPYIVSIYGILRHNRFAKLSRNINENICGTCYIRKNPEVSKNVCF